MAPDATPPRPPAPTTAAALRDRLMAALTARRDLAWTCTTATVHFRRGGKRVCSVTPAATSVTVTFRWPTATDLPERQWLAPATDEREKGWVVATVADDAALAEVLGFLTP